MLRQIANMLSAELKACLEFRFRYSCCSKTFSDYAKYSTTINEFYLLRSGEETEIFGSKISPSGEFFPLVT